MTLSTHIWYNVRVLTKCLSQCFPTRNHTLAGKVVEFRIPWLWGNKILSFKYLLFITVQCIKFHLLISVTTPPPLPPHHDPNRFLVTPPIFCSSCALISPFLQRCRWYFAPFTKVNSGCIIPLTACRINSLNLCKR